MTLRLTNDRNTAPNSDAAKLVESIGVPFVVTTETPQLKDHTFRIDTTQVNAQARVEKTDELVALEHRANVTLNSALKSVGKLETFPSDVKEGVTKALTDLAKALRPDGEGGATVQSVQALREAIDSLITVRGGIQHLEEKGAAAIKSALTKVIKSSEKVHAGLSSLDDVGSGVENALKTQVHTVSSTGLDRTYANPPELAIANFSGLSRLDTAIIPERPEFLDRAALRKAAAKREEHPSASEKSEKNPDADGKTARPEKSPAAGTKSADASVTSVVDIANKLIGEVKELFSGDLTRRQSFKIEELDKNFKLLKGEIKTGLQTIKELLDPSKDRGIWNVFRRAENRKNAEGYRHAVSEMKEELAENRRERQGRFQFCVDLMRAKFATREFSVTKETKGILPPLLVKASIPTEKYKNGTLISFNQLASLRKQAPQNVKVDQGKRIITINKDGRTLAFHDRGDGRVAVYYGGERKGIAWTDDAVKGALKFLKTGEVGFKKGNWPNRIVPPVDYFAEKARVERETQAAHKKAVSKAEPKREPSVQPAARASEPSLTTALDAASKTTADDSKKLAS